MLNKETFRVYISVNYADTWRDPDDIHIEELGYFNKEKAIDTANTFIKNKFFHKDTNLTETKNGDFFATDFCSYGKTIHLIKIEINE